MSLLRSSRRTSASSRALTATGKLTDTVRSGVAATGASLRTSRDHRGPSGSIRSSPHNGAIKEETNICFSLRAQACGRWPHHPLTVVPPLREATTLAGAVRTAVQGLRKASQPILDLARLAELGGFDIEERELSARRGMQEAMLIPRKPDRFVICVDPEPPGGWAKVDAGVQAPLRRHRMRFRIAHEIGHSFFYSRSGTEPERCVGDSELQEAFCDEFARALLVPEQITARSRVTAAAVWRVHRRFDVSVEVAARALAASWRGRAEVVIWYWRPETATPAWPCTPPIALHRQWANGSGAGADALAEVQRHLCRYASRNRLRSPLAWSVRGGEVACDPGRQQAVFVRGG